MTIAASDISVIICAYTLDRWDDIQDTISAVMEQTESPRETLLAIDNNDELLQRSQELFREVKVLSNVGGPGANGARNTAVSEASGVAVAFLDDDAVPEPDWLAELVKGFGNDNILGIGGACIPDFKTARPRWLAPEFDWVVGCSHAGLPKQDAVVRNVIAANMAVRSEVLASVGGFADELGRLARPGQAVTGTAEETEFCIRSARLNPGHHWLYSPRARVSHRVPAARTTWSYYVARCRLEGSAKATLAAREGDSMALESERAYTRSVLPRAIWRELRAALAGDVGGLRCAAAIVAGTAITAGWYAVGRARSIRT
jgi:GT2 family glycosyltransferase